MSVPRFFVPAEAGPLTAGRDMPLPASLARHAVQVLRLRDGAEVVLFDGRGGEYPGVLRVHGRDVSAVVVDHVAVEREASVAVTLVQSLVAADMMDFIVRKAVELGVASIVPVIAERSQRAPAERLDRRGARWHQIAIAACEQCGRNRIPPIAPPRPLHDWVGEHGRLDDLIMLDPTAPESLAAAAGGTAPRSVLLGPEGGLAPNEEALLLAKGARRATLGPRILRAETAAVAALALLVGLGGPAP